MTPFYDDVEIEDGIWFGEWLHSQIDEGVFFERNGFFPDQVARIADLLQNDRDVADRFTVEVPWLTLFSAFTAPGRYVYISRRLLERCPTDEAVAFIVAHEIAHHDLDHFGIYRRRFARRAMKLGPAALIVLFFRMLQHHVYSPEWETAADLRALELCVKAGLRGSECIRLMDVFEKWALYHRDFDAVYGLDRDSDQELSPEATLLTKIRIWIYLRRRGYLPIQDRRALLLEHLAVLEGSKHESKS